jgi:hypothetical protein
MGFPMAVSVIATLIEEGFTRTAEFTVTLQERVRWDNDWSGIEAWR